MEWIKCSDRLPKVGQEVLILSSQDGIMSSTLQPDGSWLKYIPSIVYGTGSDARDVSHWMPLPQKPKE